MKENLRALVRGAYDIQKLRIQTGNRLVANFKSKLGQKPQESEKTLDAEATLILNQLRAHYKKITDGVTKFPTQAKFKGDEVISSFTELCLTRQYVVMDAEEAQHFKNLKGMLAVFPIYSEFLLSVKGVGPAMAGVIVSELDPHRAKYPSSFWKYAGLDVGPDGAGRSRKKEHLVKSEYTTKDGEVKEKDGITFNPFLKTKLIGVLGPSFLKVKDSPYARNYYEYKARLENHVNHKDKTKGHRHNMAIRYSVKRFLVDLHKKGRELEGLPVSLEYAEAKLGMKHRS